MPRIDHIQGFDDEDRDENTIRVKTTKPRNPAVKELFDGRFPPKKHKDKRRSASRFDKRSIDSL